MIETRNVYQQLLDLCQRGLAERKWKAGERFPSERELAQQYGISRTTANKVLAKLVSEGWLEQRKGIGTFVAERPTLFTSLQRMESFTGFASAQGFTPSTRLLRLERNASVSPDIRKALDLPSKGQAIFLQRLRLADGEAVIFENRWLPAKYYPNLNEKGLEGSFYKLCRQHYGLQSERQIADIRAVTAPDHAEIDWPCPALMIEGVGYNSDESPIWYQQLYYRGDRFTLSNSCESATSLPKLQFNLSSG